MPKLVVTYPNASQVVKVETTMNQGKKLKPLTSNNDVTISNRLTHLKKIK